MLKVLYFVSVLFLSALSLFFSAAIEPYLLIATVPASLFLLFLPRILYGKPVKPQKYVSVKVSAQDLANMNGTQFESYVGRRLREFGYSKVKVTQASGDFGADVIAVNANGETVCIQCKHYSQPVGIKAVQEIYSAKQYYGCQKAMVITNSTYTQAAIDLAKSTGVDLWANFR